MYRIVKNKITGDYGVQHGHREPNNSIRWNNVIVYGPTLEEAIKMKNQLEDNINENWEPVDIKN